MHSRPPTNYFGGHPSPILDQDKEEQERMRQMQQQPNLSQHSAPTRQSAASLPIVTASRFTQPPVNYVPPSFSSTFAVPSSAMSVSPPVVAVNHHSIQPHQQQLQQPVTFQHASHTMHPHQGQHMQHSSPTFLPHTQPRLAMGPAALAGLSSSPPVQPHQLQPTTATTYPSSTPYASPPHAATTSAAAQGIMQRRVVGAAEGHIEHSDHEHNGKRPRRFVRVTKKTPSTWAAEIKQGFTTFFGTPGPKNPLFWPKILLALGLVVLLTGWMILAPNKSHLVTVNGVGGNHPSSMNLAVDHFEPGLDSDPHSHGHHLSELPPLTPKDVTIFTVFSPEQNAGSEHNVHLRALHSWIRRVESPEQIHVYVKDYSHCLTVQILGVTCRVSGCWDEIFDAPKLTCLLREANSRAQTELMLYVDDHIILFEDCLPALFRIGRLEKFLMLGRSSPLTLKLDSQLDLDTWQHDLESAIFLDSSAEQTQDLLGQTQFEQRQEEKESKSLHYLAYARKDLDLSSLPDSLLMDGGSFTEHGWESAFLATMLVQHDGHTHVVDVSTAVTAVEFSHKDPTNHTAILNHHNWILSTNFTGLSALHTTQKQAPWIAHLALGRLENAHYVLTGKCPTCLLKENREADLPLILLRKANSAHQIIVIATNAEYLALTFNWICRAKNLGIENYIMLAEDRVSYRILRKMDIAVVLRKDAPYRKLAAPVGSKSFQETLYLRALFFNQVVSLGFSLIMTHLDTIWLYNPLSIIAESDCDMFVQMEKESGRSSGGLLTIRNTPIGQAFTQDYLICEQENWNFIQQHGKPRFSYSDDVDIDCVELISTRLMRRNNLKRCVLDPLKYVSERDFFDRQHSQRLGVWPYFVHLNLAAGLRNKTAAFTSWHLWSVDDDAMVTVPKIAEAYSHGELHCLAPPPTLPTPKEGSDLEMKIIIHLLVSTEYKGLELTLLSLSAAKYNSDSTIIDLSITLQQPEISSPLNSKAYLKTKQLIHEFEWTHGMKSITILDAFVGPTDLWIDQWNLAQDNTAFLFVLLAGQVLSPWWFQWVTSALKHYYFDPFSYDPQLMGISLLHQLTILGESPSIRYGSRIPSSVLQAHEEELRAERLARNVTTGGARGVSDDFTKPTHHLYLYQLVPLAGTLFFPRHFGTFLQWYMHQNVSDSSVPCVPTLISNKWWSSDPVRHWWIWLTRFTFEAGWYALYTNFHAAAGTLGAGASAAKLAQSKIDGPRALVVDDQPTAGSLVISLLKRLQSSETYFPPRSELALYDFHFQLFTQPPSQLARRKFMFPPLPSSTSMSKIVEMEALAFKRGDVQEDLSIPTLTGRLALDQRQDNSLEPEHEHHLGDPEPEEDVSHLDVMIESMIQEMEERSSHAGVEVTDPTGKASLQGQPDMSTLRAQALARTSKKRGSLHTHKAHHTRPIRGVNLDRCYVVEQALQAEESTECKHCFTLHDSLKLALSQKLMKEAQAAKEAALKLGLPPPDAAAVGSEKDKHAVATAANPLALAKPQAPKPDPLAAYLTASMDAEELYNLMYDVAREKLPKPGEKYDPKSNVRFMLYQPLKPAPFDRHLRGIYFSFLVALLTNRILLIDLPDLDLLYECPFPGASWRFGDFREQLKDIRKETFENKRAAELRTMSLDMMYHVPMLIHNDMVTHDRVLFKNVMYKSFSAALFGSSSRMRRTGFVIRLLLSKPRPALLAAVAQTQQQIGLVHPKYSLAVHVVVPADKVNKPVTAADPLPGVPMRHWDCIRSFLLSLQMVSDEAVIFFSTNRPSVHAFALARKEMGRFGRVVTHPQSHNFNISTGGVSSATTSSSIALDSTGNEIIDPALVSGFILGEVDVSITSGSTYGIFYAARTNFQHKALIVKLAPPPPKKGAPQEDDYCGPMHRLDLPLQEDITY